MEIIKTDSSHPEFAALCARLDQYLNELAGGEENRAEYVPLNSVEAIQDVFLAMEGGAAVGCASYKKLTPEMAEVKRVFVSPDHRGKGLAGSLIARVETEAAAKGFRTLVVETGRDMPAAIGLYRRMGYAEIPNYGPYAGMKGSVCLAKTLYRDVN